MIDNTVSVVIPTMMNRPEQLGRAVDSVLAQTYPVNEVIIVIDGHYDGLVDLWYQKSTKITVLKTQAPKGGAFARNYGIQHATSRWVALLDDDDVWVENKLEIQLRAIMTEATEIHQAFSFTKAQVVTQHKKYVLPRMKYRPTDSVADFLFVPKLGRVQGFIQTSTFLATRALFLRYPFDESLKKHQDWDFALNLERHGVEFIYVDEVLSVYNHLTQNSVGKMNHWATSFSWINRYKGIISSSAYEHFLIGVPMKGILTDTSLSVDEVLFHYSEMDQEITFKNKCSLKYISNALAWLKYKWNNRR